jgi:hypothetical protein
VSTFQKVLLSAVIAGLAGTWAYQHREAGRLNEELRLRLAEDVQLPERPANRLPTVEAERQANPPPLNRQVAAQIAFEDDPEFTSFDNRGWPTTDAIERLNLTDDEVALLTSTIARIRDEATEDFVARATLTTSGPGDEGSYLYSYHVPARSDRGQSFLVSQFKDFQGIVDDDRARVLMSGLVDSDFLGGMGKYELDIDFTRSAGGEIVVECDYRNPETGKVTMTVQTGISSFEEDFGKVFEFPEDQ